MATSTSALAYPQELVDFFFLFARVLRTHLRVKKVVIPVPGGHNQAADHIFSDYGPVLEVWSECEERAADGGPLFSDSRSLLKPSQLCWQVNDVLEEEAVAALSFEAERAHARAAANRYRRKGWHREGMPYSFYVDDLFLWAWILAEEKVTGHRYDDEAIYYESTIVLDCDLLVIETAWSSYYRPAFSPENFPWHKAKIEEYYKAKKQLQQLERQPRSSALTPRAEERLTQKINDLVRICEEGDDLHDKLCDEHYAEFITDVQRGEINLATPSTTAFMLFAVLLSPEATQSRVDESKADDEINLDRVKADAQERLCD
jgi:hypothetical protein